MNQPAHSSALTPAAAGTPDLLQPVVRRTLEKVEPVMQLIVFRLGRDEYGIRIAQVKEVTVTPEVVRMPRTPEFVRGVSNIRGELIAIVDLEERFQIAPAEITDEEGRTYTLVVEAADYSIGFVVRQVPQASVVPLSKLEKTPDFFQNININDKYIEGILRYDDGRIVILLDILKLLRPEEILQLNTAADEAAAPEATNPPAKA